MHIKNIHEMVETLAAGLKADITPNLKASDIPAIGAAVDMLKDLCQAEYYAREAKCLEKEEKEEEKEKENWSRMGYRGQPRRANGEFASRRGYEMPYIYDPTEYYGTMGGYLGMDAPRMHYTGQVGGNMGNRTANNYMASGTMAGYSSGGNRSGGSGRSDSNYSGGNSRYGYSHDEYMDKIRETEGDNPEGQKKRREIFNQRVMEIADMLADEMESQTKEERQMWRNKLNKIINE